MSQLTYKEAQALLAELEHLTVGQVLYNTDLINALICLKQVAPEVIKEALAEVTYDIGTDNRVLAIKIYRELSYCGLKEAKDEVDAQLARTGGPITVKNVKREHVERTIKLCDSPTFNTMRLAVRWCVD